MYICVPQILQFPITCIHIHVHRVVYYKEEPNTLAKRRERNPPSPILTCLRQTTHMHKNRTLDVLPREPGVGVLCTIHVYTYAHVGVHV